MPSQDQLQIRLSSYAGYKTTASVRKPDGSPRVDPLIQKRKHFIEATGD